MLEAGNIVDWPFVDTQKGNKDGTFWELKVPKVKKLKHKCLRGGGGWVGGVVKVPKKVKAWWGWCMCVCVWGVML